VLLFLGQRLSDRVPGLPAFSTPVTQTYARQARLLAAELTARRARTIGPGPSFDSDLARVKGADVFLCFIESYGAVSFDRPAFVERLAASRAQLDADIHATGRNVVSAYVESPTFGGNSWLAHISLLTGIEVRDEDTNVLLVAQKRDWRRRSRVTATGRSPSCPACNRAGPKGSSTDSTTYTAPSGSSTADRRSVGGRFRISSRSPAWTRRKWPRSRGRRCSSFFPPPARTHRSGRLLPISPTGRVC
jgi:hypothetical protein